MTNLTLLVKASHNVQIKQIDALLQDEFSELDVEAKILGTPQNRWVQVYVSGEDEAIATSFLRKKIGLCPVTLDNIEDGAVLKGYLSKVDLTKEELKVDVGVLQPAPTLATVSLASLRTQLFGGEKVDLKRIAQNFALAEGLPIYVKITKGELGLSAELAPEQVEKLLGWRQSLLDRLIVLAVSKETVDDVLERTHLSRDVISVEPLGLFEYALTCKLGTDAAGLVSRLGRYMRYGIFVVFNAKRSYGVIG
ncbi:MAG: DUF2110 family protein [Candidatus Bathyarchaeota archaeon]|nr:DUF2110 family protein [Candidatus Bathyarchaeota archaeon]